MIGNKIADNVTSVSKKKPNNNNNNNNINNKNNNNNNNKHNNNDYNTVKLATHTKRYISPEERQQLIDELSLVPQNY